MKSKILVACNGDWYTSYIINELSKTNNDLFVINSFKGAYLILAKIILKFEYILAKFGVYFYNNLFILLKFRLFDYYTKNYIKRYKPDYVFLWAGMSKYSLKFCYSNNIKTFLFTGNEYLPEILKKSHIKMTFISKIFINQINSEFDLSDIIICESNYVKNSLKKWDNKVKVFYPVYNFEDVPGKDYESTLNICLIGLSKIKGINDFQIFLNKIEHMKINVCFNIYGLERKLKINSKFRINVFKNLEKSVFFNQLKKNHIYLNFTKSDGGPRSMFECMSFGITVLSTVNCASIDHIKSGYNGFICHNIDDFVNHLNRIYKNREIIKKISRNSKEYFRQNLSPKNNKKTFLKIVDI